VNKVGIMQPYLFPYLGYFQLINLVDNFLLYDDVQYIKRGWINRNNILVGEKRHRITFPVRGASTTKKINEVEIILDFHKIEKTIKHAYSGADYLGQTLGCLDKIFTNEQTNIVDFIEHSLSVLCSYLSIDTNIARSSDLGIDEEFSGQDRIIKLCNKLEADMYVNPEGGKKLYSASEFENNNIELRFLSSNLPAYTQPVDGFIPGLSIIDIMMHNSPEKINKMLEDYELTKS